jgi:hypothetical protein
MAGQGKDTAVLPVIGGPIFNTQQPQEGRMNQIKLHYVQVIETDTDKVVQQIECQSFRHAVQVEKGVNINLNHEAFHTEIHFAPSPDCPVSK